MPVFSPDKAGEIARAYGYDTEPRPSSRAEQNRKDLARALLEVAPVTGEASAMREKGAKQ